MFTTPAGGCCNTRKTNGRLGFDMRLYSLFRDGLIDRVPGRRRRRPIRIHFRFCLRMRAAVERAAEAVARVDATHVVPVHPQAAAQLKQDHVTTETRFSTAHARHEPSCLSASLVFSCTEA